MKYSLHTGTLNIKLLRSVCANSSSGIIICIPSSNVPVIANDVICKMLGYSELELQQLEINALFDANDWRRVSGTLSDLQKSEITSARLQLRFFTRGGDRVQAKVSISFVHEDDGAEYFIFVVEQGSSAEHGRATLTEETYKTLLNAFNGAAVLLDTSRTILMANQAMADRYATTIANLIGNDAGVFFPVELAKSRKAYIQKVITTGHPLNFVDVHNGRTLDSTIYPIFDLSGSVIKLAVYSVDVTDKTKVHQELHLKSFAIEESFNAMILALLDGTVTYVNKSFLELWRYQDLTEVIGKSGFDCFENPDYVRELARSVQDSGQWEGELTAVRGDGTTAIVHVSGKLLINTKQEPLGLMATCIDITSKRKSELALIESEKRLSLIFNTSKDAQVLWRIDVDDKFICEAANDMFTTSMTKLSPDGAATFIGLDIRVILSRVMITTETIESYLVNYRKAIATGKKVTFQGDLYLFGALSFFEITLDPVLDQDGWCTHLLMNSRDVTARRRAELALLESEERLRLALVASKQGIYDLNVVTGEAEVTSEYASMLGFDPVTFKETKSFWKERLHPDDRYEVNKTFDDYVKGKCEEYRVEFRQLAVSGEWKWILSRGKIISYTPEGLPLRMIGTHTDITELKRVERELQESQHRLNTVLNNAPVILFSIDHNGMLTLIKGMALELLGLSGSDMTGRSFFELFQDIPNAVESLKIALEGVSTRTTLHVKSNYFDTFYSPLHNEKGILVGAIGMGIDITDKVNAEQILAAKNKELQEIIDALDQNSLILEQSELKFRSLYELAPVGIALNDFATGTFLDFNDALYKETGYTRDEFYKLTFWAITPPEYREQEAEQLKSMRETGYYGPYEKEYIRKDGSRYAVLLTGMKLLDSDGREVIWSVIQDITDRKVYEKLLVQSNSRLAQIEKFIDLTTDAIQVADQEGRVVYLNHAALQRLNVSREVNNTLYVYDCEPLFETREKWEEAIEILKDKSEFTAECLTSNPHTSETNVWEITVRYVTIQSQGYIITVSRDITERKRNELRLRENEARLSEAQRMASLGYWDYDIATDKVWWSEEQLNIVQIDESEMPAGQEGYVQLIHPDDRESFLANTKRMIDKGEESSIVYRIIRPKSGEVRIIHGMAQVSRNLHGKSLKVFGVNQDITERVLAERALKESEQTLRKAQEVAKIGSWKLDMCGNILNWSVEAQKIFNMPEGIPVTQKDLLHYVHPEDREHVEKSWSSALKGDANDFVHRIIVNNKIKWVREQAELTVDEFGKPICVFGTIQDITDQKFLQDVYLTFNQSQLLTQLGSWRWTIRTNTLFWSDNTFNLYGLDKEKVEIMTYECALAAIHADDRDKVKAVNAASLKTKEPFEIEYRVLIGTDIRWLQGKGNVLTDKNGDALEMYGVVRDITDEKRDKEALEQARKASEEAASIKDEFLSVMSHEIRTPLNSVIGLSNLLLRRTPREDQLEVVKVLKSSADNLMHLVNDILDFNKIRSGNVQLEKIEFNLSEFLHEQYASSKITTQDKGLDFVIRVDSRIPRQLQGDATRLHQIFTNLLSNAIKFTHAGYVKLNADLVSFEGDRCMLRFSIEDSGVGIAADKLASVFEPFRQSGLDISRKYGGTGLGLSIVKSLVELMEGNITLNSTPGEGSVFTIEMAFGFSQTDAEKAEPSRRQTKGTAKSPSKKVRVLYVEDVASNRFLIENILSDNAIQCEAVSSGRAALRLTKAKKFDVILMDIQMPGMDGYQAADKIRWQSEGKNRNTSIIAFTAEPYSSALKTRTLEHDIQYIISKPFDQDVLIRKIKLYAKPADNRGQLFTFSFYEEAFNHDGQKLHKIKKAVISDMRRFENALKKYDKEWDLERIRNEAHRIRPIVKNLGCVELREQLDKLRLHESLATEVKPIIKESKKHLKRLLVKLENLDY